MEAMSFEIEPTLEYMQGQVDRAVDRELHTAISADDRIQVSSPTDIHVTVYLWIKDNMGEVV